jgi:protein NirF
LLFYLSLLFITVVAAGAETLYVVQRERASLAVIEDGAWAGEIPGLGDTSHATVKFWGGYGYLISRDGYLSQIDPKEGKLINKVKVGNSSIGINFVGDAVAVANYDPPNVVILDRDLNITKTIETESRNVGIKGLDNKLVFSLMDKDEVWVLDGDKDFEVLKKFSDVGRMPFDALLAERRYVVGFFNDTKIGVINLDTLEYEAITLHQGDGETVLKIPHFGLWGIAGDRVFIPANKDKKLHIVSLPDFEYEGALELIGTPVFVSASPTGEVVAVNYSGEKENFVTIVDVAGKKVERDIEIAQRLMHLRFSASGERLFVSSYFDNQVKTLEVGSWEEGEPVDVATPSGIFLVP